MISLFKLQVQDMLSKKILKREPLLVTLRINDLNDNAPRFSQIKYQAFVETLSNQISPQEIVKFDVHDKDLGIYGLPGLNCFLLGDETDKFHVDSQQQKVFLRPCDCKLDDYKSVYNFELVCKDNLGTFSRCYCCLD